MHAVLLSLTVTECFLSRLISATRSFLSLPIKHMHTNAHTTEAGDRGHGRQVQVVREGRVHAAARKVLANMLGFRYTCTDCPGQCDPQHASQPNVHTVSPADRHLVCFSFSFFFCCYACALVRLVYDWNVCVCGREKANVRVLPRRLLFPSRLLSVARLACRRLTLSHAFSHREFIKLPDGGQVSLDWYTDSSSSRSSAAASPADQPIAVFIPGLTGDSQTEYIKSLIPHAQSCGYRYALGSPCLCTCFPRCCCRRTCTHA